MNNRGQRILLLTTQGVLSFGGYYLRVKKEIYLLKKLGFNSIDLLVFTKGKESGCQSKKEILNELGTDGIYFSKVTHILYIFRFLVNYEILHAENLIPGFFAWFATRIRAKRPRLIFDYHGVTPEENYFIYDNRAQYWLYKVLEKLVLKYSDAVIVVSDTFKDYLVSKHGVSGDKLFVIRNFIECSIAVQPYQEKGALRERLKLPKDKIVLVYSGSFKKWQEEWSLVEIAKFVKKNQDQFFLIILSFDSQLSFKYRYESESWIRIVSVKRESVFDFLKAANIGILVRKNTLINRVADPSKLSEYLVSGLHVFCSGIGDFEKWTKKRNVGVFFKLKNQLLPLDMLKNLGFRAKHIEYNTDSIELASEQYSESVASESLVNCYNFVVRLN